MKTYWMNPVLNKELKLRFRAKKTFIGILFYLCTLSFLTMAFMYIQSLNNTNGFFKPENSRITFMYVSIFQFLLILFITPGLTSGVISSERERQTLNILLTTTQSEVSIIIGKLLSSIAYLVLLMIASLPLYSFVFLYGGVSPSQLIIVFLFSIFTMLVVASLGVMFSTLIRKTIVCMVTTYSAVLFIVGGTAIITMILTSLSYAFSTGNSSHFPFIYFSAMLNPVAVLIGLFEPSMLDTLKNTTGVNFPLWLAHLISYSIVFSFAIFISVKKLRPNMKRYK